MNKNLSVIMKNAHSTTRAIIAEFPAADYRATFRAALCIAWEESSPDARAEWESMTGDEQYNALIAMTWKCRENMSIECARHAVDIDGNAIFRPNPYKWIVTRDDAMSCAADAWMRMDALLTKNAAAENPMPLAIVMSRATERAATKIDRAEKRNAHASVEREDADGNTRTVIIDNAAPLAARRVSPHEFAAAVATIEIACRDNIDRTIVAGKLYGLNQSEIGSLCGIKHQNVSKRLAKMHDRIIDARNSATA